MEDYPPMYKETEMLTKCNKCEGRGFYVTHNPNCSGPADQWYIEVKCDGCDDKAIIRQFKALLAQYDRANVDYLHTEDDEEAKELKTLRYVLSDHLYHMWCDNKHIEEINRLYNYFC